VADMQVQVEDQGPVKKRVKVTVPAQRVARQFSTAYNQLAQKVAVPGFRRGKVPQKFLEQRYGARVAADVAQELIDEGWRRALDDHGIMPVSRPEIEAGPAAPATDYSFAFTVEVPPKINLLPYDGIAVEQTEWNLPEDRVDHELEHIAEHQAKFQDVSDRDDARPGDLAVIDFKGSIDGVPFAGGEGTDNEIELGSGRFIPGFEEQITGHKVGETFDVNVTFPDDYPMKDFAGKAAVFAVTLKKIQQKVVPEIGQPLADALGEENIDKVREQVRKSMQARHDQQSSREAQEAIRKVIAGQYDFELPPSMVEAALNDHRQQIIADAQQAGLDAETARSKAAADLEAAKPEVLGQLRAQLVLDAIADKENVEVGERDLSAMIEQMARSMGQYGARVRQMYRDPARRASLRARLRQEKVLEFLLTKATVTKVSKDVPAHDHGHDAEGAAE
jgi:trigger factor